MRLGSRCRHLLLGGSKTSSFRSYYQKCPSSHRPVHFQWHCQWQPNLKAASRTSASGSESAAICPPTWRGRLRLAVTPTAGAWFTVASESGGWSRLAPRALRDGPLGDQARSGWLLGLRVGRSRTGHVGRASFEAKLESSRAERRCPLANEHRAVEYLRVACI